MNNLHRLAAKFPMRTSLIPSITAAATFLLPHSLAFLPRTCNDCATGQYGRSYSSRYESSASDASANEKWDDILPLSDGSHKSSTIVIPDVLPHGNGDPFSSEGFSRRLEATITACRQLNRTSLWIEVPMSKASLIEDMVSMGINCHHTRDNYVVLNIWLQESESKIPEFATHNVGVGAVVINSRNEILCVQELRNNYLKWKTPTGLSELGEQLEEAARREVLEETGVETTFHSVLGFRQTHGLSHNRSDLYFVCRCDPVEGTADDGSPIIPQPVPQENEIARAEWVPLSEYRAMVMGHDGGKGHPMMQHVIKAMEAGNYLDREIVTSVVPGRKPNAIYVPRGVR